MIARKVEEMGTERRKKVSSLFLVPLSSLSLKSGQCEAYQGSSESSEYS